jgi:hypothetical protein
VAKKDGATRGDGRIFFEPERAREQGLANPGIDGRARQGFDFFIQLLAEALGGERIKGKSDDVEAGRQQVRSRVDCKWLGSASNG